MPVVDLYRGLEFVLKLAVSGFEAKAFIAGIDDDRVEAFGDIEGEVGPSIATREFPMELGEDWHQAGTKLKKQNVFDDFIAAAEWLIANRYTCPHKLAISGGSNGGLLVGAAVPVDFVANAAAIQAA